MGVGDIVFRNKGGDVEPERRVRLFFHDLALEPLDGLLDHLHVEIQSDGGDMSRLLFAEEVAGAADFHIGRRDAESRAQFGKLLNGRQALLRVVAQPSLHRGRGSRRRLGRRFGPTRPRNWYSCARPNMSARLTKIVLAWGTSMPDWIMAEAINTSASRRKNFNITASSGLASICPCAMTMRASGTSC